MAKRLFFGLELPASAREALAAADPQLKNVRWVKAEKLHLTLSFPGEVEPEQEGALHEALTAVRVPPFFLPIRGVGTFGGSKPSVLWAGVGKGHPHLFGLHKHLQDAVLRAGLQPDLRPFHPHVTLARIRDVSAEVLRPFLRKHAETEFGMWEVQEFVLYSSRLSSEGSEYTVELRCGLQ
ncbi:MAG TPA: RNA 2',3'-cyclic phosphodiesterase [Chthoniobacteraceae bacterium]|jgi:2'-5' RNA ligase|nr:RNA 2',3'-cyclic phosphodiesterase [Chthoniobacteraceae bacterium]